VDFVIGRKRHNTRVWSADSAIELAIRRKGHKAGIGANCNVDEINKLVEIAAKHRILVLLNLLADQDFDTLFKSTKDGYAKLSFTKGAIRKTKAKIWIVVADFEESKKFSIPLRKRK